MPSFAENILSSAPGTEKRVHFVRNGILILTSLMFVPLSTFIVVCSFLVTIPSRVFSRRIPVNKVVLVTGVGMSKGLKFARLLHEAGCKVIGADFEPDGVYVAGRFSNTIARFYRLKEPQFQSNGIQSYIDQLIQIIEQEGVDMWISCSGVATAEEDGLAKDAIEEKTACTTIQFGQKSVAALHNKDSFSDLAAELDLSGPRAAVVTSYEDAVSFLDRVEKPKTFLLKSVMLDDASRNTRVLLPLASKEDTKNYLKPLAITPQNRWLLQQYVHGKEYATYAFVQGGEVKVFVACPSKDMLMHYQPLHPVDPLFQAMLRYTRMFISKFDPQGEMTGHLSFDFIVESSWDHRGVQNNILPIECNPRVHTNLLLLDNDRSLQQAYLGALNRDKVANQPVSDVHISPTIHGCYWIGHDLVDLVGVPLLKAIISPGSMSELCTSISSFLYHLIYWKEGAFSLSDPAPWWWLYHVYWPGVFLMCMLNDRRWTRVNVSTGKVFRC